MKQAIYALLLLLLWSCGHHHYTCRLDLTKKDLAELSKHAPEKKGVFCRKHPIS